MKILFGILLLIFYIIMMSIMIIFERDKPKNIILWSILFLFTQVIGYVIYLFSRKTYYDKRNTLIVKQKEDEVYKGLVSKKLNHKRIKYSDELFEHNALAFDAPVTNNNDFEIFNEFEDFREDLESELKSSKKYILIEVNKINKAEFNSLVDILVDRAENDVLVKIISDKRVPRKIRKTLKLAGVKIYRFSKKNLIDKLYSNYRNVIVVDGRVAFLANLNVTKGQRQDQVEVANAILKVKGDVVQTINLNLHQDVVFASGKYIEYSEHKKESVTNPSLAQFVSNKYESNIELLLIKAICMAKKSIQMELSSFIPTESIMSLLHFAINSNIDVRLMVPLKTDLGNKFYASRAYAKELALLGANSYLYDGYIRFNAITIDSEYVLYGSFTLDRVFITNGLQNVCVIKDEKVVNHFNKLFDEGIDNSYRINNAKFMLVREKFFKNFV